MWFFKVIVDNYLIRNYIVDNYLIRIYIVNEFVKVNVVFKYFFC